MISPKSDTEILPIILTGSVAFDRVMSFDGSFAQLIQPDKLHVLSISPLVDKMEVSCGGTAGNIAYNLALLGSKSILYASVGLDATEYLKQLESIGVNTKHVHFSEKLTATFSVLTDKKNCQVGGFYPGAMSDSSQLKIAKIAQKDSLVVISAHDPETMMNQVAECHQHKLRLLFDPGQQCHILTGEQLKLGISTAEVMIVNDYEMGMIAQKTGLDIESTRSKLKTLIITLGDQGSRVYNSNESHSTLVPAAKVTQVIDPTGAGDAFRAGFLFGYIRGLSTTICARLGSSCATYAIEKTGTQNHTFTAQEFFKRYRDNYPASDLAAIETKH